LTADEGAAVPHPTPAMRPDLQIWQVFSGDLSSGIHPSFVRLTSVHHLSSLLEEKLTDFQENNTEIKDICILALNQLFVVFNLKVND